MNKKVYTTPEIEVRSVAPLSFISVSLHVTDDRNGNWNAEGKEQQKDGWEVIGN